MPEWFQVISQFDPLTYAVDTIRKLILGGELEPLGGSFAVMDIHPSLLFDAPILLLLLFLTASLLFAVTIARKALI